MKALNDLRIKAEKMVERVIDVGPFDQQVQRTKRPTFAPPIHPLGEELVTLLFEVNWLSADELAIARLWARFTSPRRGPVRCEGFELRAGQKHNGGKIWTGQYFDKERVLENLERQIEEATKPQVLSFLEDALRVTRAKTGGWSFGPRWSWSGEPGQLEKLKRIVELGHTRVMSFAGDPDTQIRAGGRYWGHCAICGKALSEPHSIEYGVGPECRRRYDITIPQAPGQWIIGGSDANVAA
jgi:hypothetical protein